MELQEVELEGMNTLHGWKEAEKLLRHLHGNDGLSSPVLSFSSLEAQLVGLWLGKSGPTRLTAVRRRHQVLTLRAQSVTPITPVTLQKMIDFTHPFTASRTQ